MTIQSIKVTCRDNDGTDTEHQATDTAEAERIAKSLRTPSSYMVCLVVDGVKAKRWDRTKNIGENRWRAVDVNAFQTLGPIRQVVAMRR